ncbi:hypothetical protein JCM10908_000045 [Rhodotorula pacifica]|uniref:uncharacterized protein n=1 Tax=Rhodotorula pacifica TaxID=1495444 RepID=UPI00317EF3D2
MSSPTCLVCAQPAKLRCGACAPKMELAFCTKEHQKLAWPAHKLACGERCMPFQLPPFSEYERDRAEMAVRFQASSKMQKTSQDLIRAALAPAESDGEIAREIARCRGQNCQLILNSPRKRDKVELIRANSASFWKNSAMGGRPFHTTPLENFITYHTATAGLGPVPAPNGPSDDKFDTEFYHRVLVFATLEQQAETQHERKAPFAAYTTKELADLSDASGKALLGWAAKTASTAHQEAVYDNIVLYFNRHRCHH